MTLQNQLVEILTQVLQLNGKAVTQMNDETRLLGAIPEFDSMAVVTIITALEDRFGFAVDDDEIDASVFENVGTLVAFVEGKLA
jgi:acyl carrier protein